MPLAQPLAPTLSTPATAFRSFASRRAAAGRTPMPREPRGSMHRTSRDGRSTSGLRVASTNGATSASTRTDAAKLIARARLPS